MDFSEAKAFLKKKLLLDKTTLYGFQENREQVKDLLIRTAKHSESNSAILVGPKKSGKSTVSKYHNLFSLTLIIFFFLLLASKFCTF